VMGWTERKRPAPGRRILGRPSAGNREGRSILRLTLVLTVMCLACLGWVGGPLAGTLKIVRPGEDPEIKALNQARFTRWINPPLKDVPSKRKLLKSTAGKFPPLSGEVPVSTLRVCAIRVEFASVPSPSKITGNGGRFDLSDRRHEVLIDPPPHDRAYFAKHMEALAYYYRAMSYGRLEIVSEVFPRDNDSAYVLEDVGRYNPGGGPFTWEGEGLELFFKDAVRAADGDPDLDFSDFDAVVVFHAGSDWQNDIQGDSPYDIPSFFITLYDDSVAVDDSTHFIVDGAVVPETTSQDGYLNGINGVLAHEVGHQLGLPDLYDAATGISVVGYWCLMDYGTGIGVVLADTLTDDAYYVTGILPGSLCAWSREYLGWVSPREVTEEGDFSLDAVELQEGYPGEGVLRVPMNSYEYYLIENRQADLDGDDMGYLLSDPGPDSTGVIMGPVNDKSEFNYEFDFALPGSGLLIWLVDQIMVQVLGPFDLVNAFPERRGIQLMEADGIPDLGDYNSFYFLGSEFDPFRAGNNDRFSDDTYPASTSNTGCHSHITVDDIGESGTTMDFHVAFDWGLEGFPLSLGDQLRFSVPSILACDSDGDGRDEIYAALTRAGWMDTLGLTYVRSEIHAFESNSFGEIQPMPGWPRRLLGSHPLELVCVDFDGDGELEIVAADETGSIYGFGADGTPFFPGSDSLGVFFRASGNINGGPVAAAVGPGASGRPDFVFAGTDSGFHTLSLSGGLTDVPAQGEGGCSMPIVADILDDGSQPGRPEVVFYRRGEIAIFDPGEQEIVRTIPVPTDAAPDRVYLCAADFDRSQDDDLEIILVDKDGWVFMLKPDGEPLPGFGRRVCGTVAAPPALADVNSDGYLELVLSDRDYRSWVLLRTGSTAPGWPRRWYGCTLPTWDSSSYAPASLEPLPSPVLVDFDSDTGLDVIQGSLFECIAAWDSGGQRLQGFPLTLGGGCSALSLGDLDGDGVLEMLAGGSDGRTDLYLLGEYLGSVQYSEGYVYGFRHPLASGDAQSPWKTAFFDGTRNAVYPLDQMPGSPLPGNRVLVAGSFHAFPNPAGEAHPVTGEKRVWFVFESDTGGHASIDVYDITGALVKTVEYDASGQSSLVAVPPEGVDISGLGSGLYVCRLNLRADGKSVTDLFKLAVKR
jgi:M6 family metalloprotease-like protein